MSPGDGAAAAGGTFPKPREIRVLGDLFASIWQLGYVTNDIDRATETLRERYGIEDCLTVSSEGSTFLVGDEPADWEARFAMAARGGPILEVIEPVSGPLDFYRRLLPDDGSYALRLHHVATHVPLGDETWDAIRALLAANGLRFDYTVIIPGRVRAGYIDTSAELGHMLEVCQLQPADVEFFSGLVAGSA